MKRFLLICMMAICGGLNMVADEIGVSNVVYIQPEGTTTISINLSNQKTNYVSFQMDLYLPSGFTLNRAGCSLSSRFAYDDQELTIGKQANGAYRLTSTSFTLSPIRGTDGTLLTISVTAGAEAVSGTAQIRNIRFATSESEKIIMGDTDFYICIMVPKFKVDDVAR